MGMLLISAVFAFATVANNPRPYLHVPSIDHYAFHNPEGTTILPEGRYLRPAGWATPVAQWPHGLSISPDGNTVFIASAGTGEFISNWTDQAAKQISPFMAGSRRKGANSGASAFSADGKTLYWSSGESGKVLSLDIATGKEVLSADLNVPFADRKFVDSYVNDIVLSEDGKTLFAADSTNFRLVAIDTESSKVVGSVQVGRYPFALARSGKKVYVANIGQFQYSLNPAPTKPGFDRRGLTFPPFGYPSKEAENGVKDLEGRDIPGLGSPTAPEAFSVFGVETSDPTNLKVTSKTKTGLAVFSSQDWGKVVGGSGPSYLLADQSSVFVANNGNDSVQELDAANGKSKRTVVLEPSPLVHGLKGVGPTGLAVSPDGSRLYVAESGLNAIAVIDRKSFKVLGHIPTAWYPYRVEVSKDGKFLATICFKGYGNGPRGGSNVPKDPYVGMRGSFHTIPVPTDQQLAAETRVVLENNGIVDSSADLSKMKSPVWSSVPGKPSEQIQYVVFITKENHTFDTIFDRVPGTNNDPKLLQWGLDQTVAGTGQPTLEHVGVMVNHNALARQFTVSDNFYMEPEASGVGHRWLIGVQPNNWCQMMYTLGWDFKPSTAPGRLASFGSNGSIAPEDYPEAGTMWDHLARHKISFRSYGEGFEFAGGPEDADMEESGIRENVNIPMPKVLYNNTSREFANFNLNIPDQYRVIQFKRDLAKLQKEGKAFPHFINICICCDHGTGPNPKIGYKYRASYMADNDAALGQLVDLLSHTPYWKKMAIFVTQDDAGGEQDHVDAQRSVLLAISPYIKRGYVSHRQTTITSMHRTMYEIFGLPPMSLFDALPNDFSDCFTATPDFTPYKYVDIDHRIYDFASVQRSDPKFSRAMKLPIVARDHWDRD